jgi:sugar phosphate isomerase/epimerase
MNNRRTFIKNSTLLAGGFAIGESLLAETSFNSFKVDPKLSFSTLGCPKWSLNEVLSFAASNGYKGIELRGLAGEIDLRKCPDFSSPDNISTVKKMLAGKKLSIVNLGSSAELHHADAAKRQSNIQDAKDYINLASALDSPFIRVFPNNLPPSQDKAETLKLISSGLLELSEFAKDKPVSILMETHGDLVVSDDILQIMQSVNQPNVGLIWDIYNMWTITKEPPAEMYRKLHPYIRHTHIKDSVKTDGKEHYVLLGTGEAPVAEALKELKKGKYKGYYSFEWEKLWHPEIEEPEKALAHFPGAFRKIYESAG